MIPQFRLFCFAFVLTVYSGCSSPTQAQIPDYYSSIDFEQNGSGLKDDLATLITSTHTTNIDYTPGVWDALMVTDLDPDDTTNQDVLLIYGYNDTNSEPRDDRTRDKALNGGGTGEWNREHVYPRSLGTPNLGFENAGSDVHALRASDVDMNSRRANRKFETGNGNADITPSGNWYPGDEWKGDVARMMMYMFLHYPTQAVANNVAISGNTYSSEMPDIFLEWNAEDPVSEYERQRNEHLETVQGNRNPFIDNPYLATLIWDGPQAEDTFDLLSTSELELEEVALKIFPNPTTEMVSYQSNQKPSKIIIYSANGSIIDSSVSLSGNEFSLPKPKGWYLVEFRFLKKVIVKKILKQ